MTGFVWGMVFGLGASLIIAAATVLGVWWERRFAGRIQMRIGPEETGPIGLLQTVADVLKLILKEDVTPGQADRRIFRMAPFIVFAPVAISLVVVPFTSGWAPVDASVGALFFLAVPSVAVIGILAAGLSSGNTYATIGGLRAAAQMVSYELPRTLSVLALVVLAGTMQPTEMIAAWEWWWIPLNLIGFIVFFIASIAEVNRGPFDLPEAESELVAGYFADYSGIRWAIFMLSEYGGVVASSLFAAVFFFGAVRWLPGAFGTLALIAVAVVLVTTIIWIKWTFPRMRADQLMSTAWKVLTPMALAQLLLVGLVVPWL
jgi:NADH-quinone oxidoreductase subunit H